MFQMRKSLLTDRNSSLSTETVLENIHEEGKQIISILTQNKTNKYDMPVPGLYSFLVHYPLPSHHFLFVPACPIENSMEEPPLSNVGTQT